jgi:Fe-S-cluster containining protein
MTKETFATLAELAGQRQIELDEAIAAWRQGQGAGVRLWCGPGCGNCCTLTVNATLAEAMAIAAILDEPRQQCLAKAVGRIVVHARQSSAARAFLAGYKQAVGPCPFLDEGNQCAIYAARPLACRALLATRPADWCGVNLAELPGYERDAFLASLDRKLVAFPTHYAVIPQELAADCERGLIFAMLRLIGFGVTGNLPLLVWLCGQAGFGDALAGGPAAFSTFLADHRGNLPFLIQFHTP